VDGAGTGTGSALGEGFFFLFWDISTCLTCFTMLHKPDFGSEFKVRLHFSQVGPFGQHIAMTWEWAAPLPRAFPNNLKFESGSEAPIFPFRTGIVPKPPV
jgi:hypothetical protein